MRTTHRKIERSKTRPAITYLSWPSWSPHPRQLQLLPRTQSCPRLRAHGVPSIKGPRPVSRGLDLALASTQNLRGNLTCLSADLVLRATLATRYPRLIHALPTKLVNAGWAVCRLRQEADRHPH